MGDPEAENRLYGGLGGPMWWPVGAQWQRRVAARTRFLDDVTLSAIDAGVTQVVIVGAGYDGRALRFAGAELLLLDRIHCEAEAVVLILRNRDRTERSNPSAGDRLPCLIDKEQHGPTPYDTASAQRVCAAAGRWVACDGGRTLMMRPG
jgi:hypothetical protein